VNLLRIRRGVSGIISGVFLVGLTVMIFSALSWQFFRADQYNQVVLERQQREWERFNERLTITNVQTGVNTLRFDVINYGSVSAQITDLYLTNLSATPHSHSRHSQNIWMALGTAKTIDTVVTIEVGDTYRFIVTTARGNAFAPSATYIVNEAQPLGGQTVPFTLSFLSDSFQYITSGQTWNDNRSAWYMTEKKGTAVVFRLNVTNNYDRDVRLLSGCNMLMITPDPQGNLKAGYKMFIVKEETTIVGGNVQRFPLDGQWIPAKKSRYLYFSATSENGTTPTSLINNVEDNNYINFGAIFYKIKDDPLNTTYGATVGIIAMQIKTTN